MKSVFTTMLLCGILTLSYGQCDIDSVIMKSLLIDPSGAGNNFDTNGDGTANSQDEYIEICNTSTITSVAVSGWKFGDDDSGAFPDYEIPANTIMAPGDCLLLVNDYCPTLDDPGTCNPPAGILSMDFLNSVLLGNGGDVITMSKNDDSASCSAVYGGVQCSDIDPLDIPPFDINTCEDWGSDIDGCPLLVSGDSCNYLPQALPIDLVEFFVRKYDEHNVMLEWTTASELNNDKFLIEWGRSPNDMTVIGELDGAGTSNEFNHYNYLHEDPGHGINYYQLRQIDYDGAYTMSDIRSINVIKFSDPIIYPTILDNNLTIAGELEYYNLKIFDLNGQLKYEAKQIKSSESIRINLDHSGFYVASISDGENVFNYSLIKI